jgi:Transposase DDE domain group 1
VVNRYQKTGMRLLFRGDAAFARPEVYEYLESRDIGYAIRLPANEVLHEQIRYLLERPTEWSARGPIVSYHDFAYQAQSWHLPRRVVAKVEWHQGELFPRVGFIVTNLSYPPKGIIRFYNGRGTAEQWIKEGKYALNWTRLSCHKFVANQVRLWLFVLAYNLGNFMRRLALPESVNHWSLTSIQTRLIKTGGRLVHHARRLVFQLAEILVTREMLTGMLERISRLRLAPG